MAFEESLLSKARIGRVLTALLLLSAIAEGFHIMGRITKLLARGI
jgi:hypothetical protein